MNKHLLLGTALLVAISAFPQAGKLTKPSGILPNAPKKLDYNESSITNAASFSGTPKQIKHVTTNAAKTSTFIVSNRFTGSMNVFGYLVSNSRPLQYKKGINAVSMVARKDGTYTPTSNGNSGSIVGHWTLNLGTTWDATCIWANATNLGRYPNGGIYNPSGNTNINNAYFVGSGPITGGSGWLGNWYASKQITTPGNPTPGADQQSMLSATPTIKKHEFARYSFNTIEGGLARSIAEVMNDPNGTTYATQGTRGAAMVKGVFTAGTFTWSVDSFCPPVNRTVTSPTYALVFGAPIQAWDEAGVNGYVILFGSRLGELSNATHASPKGGVQPIIYKTTTGGTSWSLLPAVDFADKTQFRGVYERAYPIATNSNVVIANFQGSEGYDAAVDVNGNLHLASMIYGHNQSQLDSLGYRYVFGTEQYSWGETGAFEYPIIYDFYTTSLGGWGYHMVDSMGTEGPSGTSGQPGYGSNVWSDGSGAKMSQDARLQVSRSVDGKKIFYSWSESDSAIVGLKWNIYPDIKWKGYDVTIQKVTPRMNATTGDINVDQGAYYQYMCDKAVGASSVCLTMPWTVTKNATLNGGVNVDTYFLAGQVCPTSFSINPMSPTGVATLNNPAVNFDVFNYPNPADAATTIIIGLKKAENIEVVLYSSVGQILTTYKINGQFGSNEINIDLSGYSAGVYFYNVKVGNSVVTKKLIVQ